MTNNIPQYHADNLIEALEKNGFATDESLADYIITEHQKQDLPLFLKILTGIGAFIASLLFFIFIFFSFDIDFDSRQQVTILAIFFIAIAIGIQIGIKKNKATGYHFFAQLAIASLLIGYTLLIIGAVIDISSLWYISLVLFIATTVTYPFNSMPIARFLTVLSLLFSILIALLCEDIGIYQEVVFNTFILIQLICLSTLYGMIKTTYIPIVYAAILSTCATLLSLTSSSTHIFFMYYNTPFISPIFTNTILSLGLIGLLATAAGGIKKLKCQPLILASIGILLLGVISASGILFAIGFMILGHFKQEKLLSIIGILFMIIFLILYYYNLHVSLLIKSLILMGSGTILLIGRLYLKYKNWDKVDTSCEQK